MMNEKTPLLDRFRPLPLLGNAHFQTVLAHLIPAPRFRHPVDRHLLWLPDGDGILYYDSTPKNWKPTDPIAVLLHGLAGTHASKPNVRMANYLMRRGIRVVRVDLRGAGAGLPLARRFYHAGRSDDVLAILKDLHRRSPSSPLWLVGVSLGGNLALKMAGENPDFAPLTRVAALSPPIDLGVCSDLLCHRRNRIYQSHFLAELTAAAALRQQHFPDLPPLEFPENLDVRLYDEYYTAPRSGYRDADDYYLQCSALPLIDRIAVPTLILTAQDDPFIAVEPFLTLKAPAHIEVHVAPRGGHVGFLGWHKSGSIFWAENQLIEWLSTNAESGKRNAE